MNIINYSIESELLGSRQLNAHPNRGRSISGLSKASTDFKSMSNVDNFTRKLPTILREKEYDLSKSQINKIFCAQWLDERRVLMGTKCNKLVTLNTDNGQYSVQEPLKSHRKSTNIQNHCGLHSISINPSRTLLATGAEHVNDIGIYSLPDMKPVSVGYGAHSYWIFDTLWLDDQHVCSGAGDNKLALWKIDTDSIHPRSSQQRSLNSTGGSSSSLSQTSPCSSSSNSKSKIYSHDQQRTSQRPHRACKRQLPSSSSLSFLESTTSTSSTSLSNLYNNFNTTYSMLTQASSFNSLASNYFRQSVIYPTVPIRYRVNTSQSMYANYRPSAEFLPASSQYQDNNNNISYFNEYYDRDQQAQYVIGTEENEAENRLDYNRLRPSFSNARMTSMQNDNLIEYHDELHYYSPGQEQDEEIEEEALSESQIDELVWNELERTNDFPNEQIGSDIDEENDDMESENALSSDESDDEDDEEDEDDNNNFSFSSKRRRLNSRGKFTKPPVDRIKYNKPTKVIKCKQSKRIRAMAYNPKRNEIAAISMNAAFHYFDVQRFEQKYTKKLSPVLKENVCLAINDDYTIYAIGSASHVQLLDSNNAKQLVNPVFIKKDIGVRSVNFRNNILSIGTGTGSVMFYDLRVHRFLEDESDKSKMKLQTNGGWILRNENYYENLPYAFNTDNTHAIYAHSYDPSGTKLLTVGGPLTVNFFGHYAGVWR